MSSYNELQIECVICFNKVFFNIILTFYCFLYINTSYALQSEWNGIEEAKVRLISSITNNSNSVFYLGLEYQLQKGWKTYWRDPGDGGFPQTLDWSKSKNISKLEILWPTPIEFEILGLKSIGYKNKVIFPLKINVENINLSSNLLLDVNFLTCKDICIPGNATLQLVVPPGDGQLTKHSLSIEKYISKVPLKNNIISGLKILNVSSITDQYLTFLKIEASSVKPFIEPKFFLHTNLGLPVQSPQYTYSTNRKIVEAGFIFDKSLFIKNNFDLSILLKDRNNAIEYVSNINQEKVSNLSLANQSFYYIFLIALIGGLILNFMPCVLPVLSIKLLTIINKGNTSISLIRKSFFITSLGIITSFIFLALVLMTLKITGINISWGMQFQQPLFLMIIALILLFFAINLFGLFEFKIPQFISNSSNFSFNNKFFFNDYFNGVFATILATPCSAPFVGTAITAAFTQSFFILIGIFFFMGLGMATPFLLASIFPGSVRFLPKPGPWMNYIKYILGFFLLGTVVWIGTILNNHFNFMYMIISFILASFIITSFVYLHKFKRLAIFFAILIFFSLNYFSIFHKESTKIDKDWLDITKIHLNDLISENNLIFVDITADWCVTCQFNKINVLNSKQILNIFKNNNIIKIRGDWTKPDKDIENYLNTFNRFGIPFNVMYNKHYPHGIVLSEILTTKEIMDTIEKLKEKN